MKAKWYQCGIGLAALVEQDRHWT